MRDARAQAHYGRSWAQGHGVIPGAPAGGPQPSGLMFVENPTSAHLRAFVTPNAKAPRPGVGIKRGTFRSIRALGDLKIRRETGARQ
jgi:hypothetical protein